jgi:antitoxin MazE
MINTHQTQIIKIGNSNGIRIPKEYLHSFNSKNVVIELINDSLVITPVKSIVPPRNKWAEILSKTKIETEDDFKDFDITLTDGVDDL